MGRTPRRPSCRRGARRIRSSAERGRANFRSRGVEQERVERALLMAAVRWGVATDPGPLRAKNEDSVLAKMPIFAVADGMGGHADGEIASDIAVRELEALAARRLVTKEDIAEAIGRANKRILDVAETNGSNGMGTTVSGIAM